MIKKNIDVSVCVYIVLKSATWAFRGMLGISIAFKNFVRLCDTRASITNGAKKLTMTFLRVYRTSLHIAIVLRMKIVSYDVYLRTIVAKCLKI